MNWNDVAKMTRAYREVAKKLNTPIMLNPFNNQIICGVHDCNWIENAYGLCTEHAAMFEKELTTTR